MNTELRMLAAVVRSAQHGFVVESVRLARPLDDEVRVRIHGVGICHTDIAAASQHLPVQLPVVLGHEGAGIVDHVGSAVTKVIPGDRVLLTFDSCGECKSCIRGEPPYCQNFSLLNFACRRSDGTASVCDQSGTIGSFFFGQSSFGEFAICHQRNLVKIPRDFPLELAGPLGCGVQTGAGAIMRALSCRAGSTILILGAGTVGLSAVMGAAIQGCAGIIVSEPHAARRELARSLGATTTIAANAGDLARLVREVLPEGVDYVFDTSGKKEVIEAGISALAPRGVIGIVGAPSEMSATVEVNMLDFIGRGLCLRGIVEGDSEPDEFIPKLIGLYREGRFPFDRMIKTYPLEQINQAVRDQLSGVCVKPVLLMPGRHVGRSADGSTVSAELIT